MVPSLAVVLLAAGVIYLFVPHNEDVNPVKPIGYKVELDSARRAAPYPVLAPEGLPKRWRATSVTYEADGRNSAAWHLGFITPDTQYAAVEQSDETRSEKFIKDVTRGARKTTQTSQVNGQEWTRYEGEKYDALVRKVAAGADGKAAQKGKGEATARKGARTHTVVVTGTATFQQLEKMAAALSAGDKGEDGDRAGARRS
jgi:hypothetical protein